MKKILIEFAILLLFTFTGSITKAQQDTIVVFDTIKFEQPNYYVNDFTLSDTLIHTFSIQISPEVQMKDVQFKIAGNVVAGIMTFFTGIGFGSTQDVDWFLTSKIRTNIPQLDWIYDVYCTGYIVKQRTQVRRNDNLTVETRYINEFSWHKGALGFIIEEKDTIGWHYLYANPTKDTVLWKGDLSLYDGKQKYTPLYYWRFGLIGELSGKESRILYDQGESRIYMFSGDKILGIYQCQTAPQYKLKKKKRIIAKPYLLLNNALTEWERFDALRLAMVGIRMKSAIGAS